MKIKAEALEKNHLLRKVHLRVDLVIKKEAEKEVNLSYLKQNL